MNDILSLQSGPARRFAFCLALWLFTAVFGLPAQSITHRHYIGTVGTYPVQMDLTIGREVSGNYFYDRKGDLISLQGQEDAHGSIKLEETSPGKDGGAVTGTFRLKVSQEESSVQLEGQWTSAGGGKTLPVKLKESLHYVTTGIGSGKNPGGATQEEPVFFDGFKTLHEKGIGHTVASAKSVKVNHKIAEMKNYVCLWHRPNLSLSLRVLETENYNPGPGMGKTDWFYSFLNYRMVAGKAVSLQLKDFFLSGPNWERVLRTQTGQPEDTDVTNLPFSLSDEGLRFHKEEAKFDDEPTLVRWKDLQDHLKPGWPQVLGVGPKLPYDVPQPGSPTRQSICDAVRAYKTKDDDSRRTLKLLIQSLRVKDIWCVLSCQFLNAKDGRDHEEEGDATTYVLKKIGGNWKVKVEYIDGDPGSYEFYKKELPGVPDIILEGWTMKTPATNNAGTLKGE